MGPIHKRQTLSFQVLIWCLVFLVDLPSLYAADKPASSSISAEIADIAQKASKKKDFSAELQQVLKHETKAIAPLQTIYEDSAKDWHERWFAAMALSKIENDKAKKILIKGMSDQLAIIRWGTVQALAAIDDEDSLKAIRTAIQDPALTVRNAAIKSAGKLRDRKAVEFLATELYSQKNYYRGEALFGIRENIIHSIGEIGSMTGVQPLVKIFEEPNTKLHNMACTALDKIVRDDKDSSYPTIKAKKSCPTDWLFWYKNRFKSTNANAM